MSALRTGLVAKSHRTAAWEKQFREAAAISYRQIELLATTAYGVYNIESLAAYETYRARLADSEPGRRNYEFARRERFILKEDRIFLKLVSAPYAQGESR